MPTTDEDAPPPRPARRSRSVRGHLWVFTAALVTPVLLFAGFLFWQVASRERAGLEGDAVDLARTVALSIDRDMSGLFASLDVLSLSPYLQTGDFKAFYNQAAELAKRQGFVPVLADMSGRQLVNLRVPWGTPLPATNLPRDAGAEASGRPFVTDLFQGVVSSRPIFAVAIPVAVGGKPTYMLNFSLDLDRLQHILAENDIPPSWIVSVVDRKGFVMARNSRPAEFVGKLATQDLRDNSAGQQGTWSGRTLDGQAIFGAYSRSRLSGFRVAVGVGRGDLNAPLWQSLALFSALGLVIAALSVVLGVYFGRHITDPIRALADRAGALGRGEPVLALETGLREANDVGAELAAASTSLREREADLREANDEIQRFAYIVSHDLRSPLVNIMGFTTEMETLRTEVFDRIATLRTEAGAGDAGSDERLAEDVDEALRFIKTSIGKMDRLIHAILDLSRAGRREFHPERVDMTALADGIRASLAHQTEEAAGEIRVGPLPSIESDRLALEQIFSNLVDNALKYRRNDVPVRIDVGGQASRGVLVYEVRDNGRGIDPKDRERVFELFRRSGVQDRPGEGIGLAHVRALIRRLGGTISLTSTPGQGSTFTVTLPRRWTGERQGKAA